MPIEEKPRALEFTFVDKVNSSLRYEITYDSQLTIPPIEVSYNGANLSMPIELFVEVVDFLKQKGVITGGGTTKKLITTGQKNSKKTKVIPLPVIDGQEEKEQEEQEVMIKTNPITSFSEPTESEEILKEIVKEEKTSQENIIIAEEHEYVADTDNIYAQLKSSSLPEEKKDDIIPKRTVIKTKKFDKDDPMGAERDAAELRDKKESNFRRKE